MLAPVKVLHLPDPKGLAIERLGEARAEELLREGADTAGRAGHRRRPRRARSERLA